MKAMKKIYQILVAIALGIMFAMPLVQAETGCEKRVRLWKLGDSTPDTRDGKLKPGSPYCVPFVKLPYGPTDFMCINYGLDLLAAEGWCKAEQDVFSKAVSKA